MGASTALQGRTDLIKIRAFCHPNGVAKTPMRVRDERKGKRGGERERERESFGDGNKACIKNLNYI